MIEKTLFLKGSGTDPYHNLAVEKYLTENVEKDQCILYLWQNEKTVVIGRNQNAWKECRITDLQNDGGKLARRLSGGGAVFHDLGNLNFTFSETTENFDTKRHCNVIMESCKRLGITVSLSGRNDFTVDGRKISGNSFYSHAGRCFHNGTLLINADMSAMSRYLSPSKLKLDTKGVDSVRSRVMNLSDVNPKLTIAKMCKALRESFELVYGFSPVEIDERSLPQEKIEENKAQFESHQWIYGRNADFPVLFEKRFGWGEIQIHMQVTKGICSDVVINTDAMDEGFAVVLEKALNMVRFGSEELCAAVRGIPECEAYEKDICSMIMELGC